MRPYWTNIVNMQELICILLVGNFTFKNGHTIRTMKLMQLKFELDGEN